MSGESRAASEGAPDAAKLPSALAGAAVVSAYAAMDMTGRGA